MLNSENWEPSKYVFANGKLRASRNTKELSVGSRLITDSVATLYQQYIPLHAKGRLLDLGCGKVPLFELYRPHVAENICADWANSLHKNSHLDLECDLSARLPFPDASFDTVILSDVLEHIPEPMALWREIDRLLVPGGVLLMNVPFFYWLHEEPHDFYRYTEFALRRFAQSTSFQILELKTVGGLPEILADLAGKVAAKVPVMGPAVTRLIQATVAWFVRGNFGRHVSATTSKKFPQGYFMVVRKPF